MKSIKEIIEEECEVVFDLTIGVHNGAVFVTGPSDQQYTAQGASETSLATFVKSLGRKIE